jgi:hypothetical protein
MMAVLAQDRPALIPELGKADAGAPPPGAGNIATLLEIVGIAIFLALLTGVVVTLIRRYRRS